MELVKSTINIPVRIKEELNRFVELKVVPSFSSGVNTAIEVYLKELRRIEYDKQMEEAAGDKAFIKRTMDCQEEAAKFEGAVTGEW